MSVLWALTTVVGEGRMMASTDTGRVSLFIFLVEISVALERWTPDQYEVFGQWGIRHKELKNRLSDAAVSRGK